MVEGFICKKGKQEGSFWKMGYKGRGSLVNRGKVGGFGQKPLLLPLPTLGNRGGEGATPAAPEAGGLGSMALREEGEKREEEVGVLFPYLAQAGVEQGGGATGAGGGGHDGSGSGTRG